MDPDDERRGAPGPTGVIELRQYEMRPGGRDVLIELFQRVLVAGQEREGMRILGQFRDADRPQRFVWIRGFAGMEQRRGALERFYTGAVWAAHREEANATMIDVSNVLLLRPCGSTFLDRGTPSGSAGSVIVVTVRPASDPEPAAVAETVGGDMLGRFETEPSENTYPRLPIRSDDVRVDLRRFASAADASPYVASLHDVEHLVLLPTPSSWLR